MKTSESLTRSKRAIYFIFLEYGRNMKMTNSKMFKVLLVLVLFSSSSWLQATEGEDWVRISPINYLNTNLTQHVRSSKCLDGTETEYENANAIIYDCHQFPMIYQTQTWMMKHVGGNRVKFHHSYHPLLCLVPDAIGGWNFRGVNIRLQAWGDLDLSTYTYSEACDSYSAQWHTEEQQDPDSSEPLIVDGFPAMKFKNAATGRYLSIAYWHDYADRNGKNVMQGGDDDEQDIIWAVMPTPRPPQYAPIIGNNNDRYWNKAVPAHLEEPDPPAQPRISKKLPSGYILPHIEIE